MVLAHIIFQMEIYIKVNGQMVNLMVKEIIFIHKIKVFIRAIGKMDGNRVLENL